MTAPPAFSVHGGPRHGWTVKGSPPAWLPLAAGALLTAGYAVWARRRERPPRCG